MDVQWCVIVERVCLHVGFFYAELEVDERSKVTCSPVIVQCQ